MMNKNKDNENFQLFALQFRILYPQPYQITLIPHYQNSIAMFLLAFPNLELASQCINCRDSEEFHELHCRSLSP